MPASCKVTVGTFPVVSPGRVTQNFSLGWFSKDQLLGSATVKLAPLETQVTLHDSFQLMDGRRPAGGSLEVKLRVRTPLAQQQFENTTHRWLVIDN